MKKAEPADPIGVFDSGIGGLTVASAIANYLPEEEIIYLGDTAHLPYGDKSADAIRYYAIKIAKFLLKKKCKMIVIACNSASSAAYEVLLDFFEGEVLFVNVVDPLVEAVTKESFEKVGVIATKATIRSGIYKTKLLEKQMGLKVSSKATPLLVPMIEEGFFKNKISEGIIESYLGDHEFENIEALLLACTHYPLIRKEIEAYFEGRVKVFDSTDVVARAVKEKLERHGLLNDKKQNPHHFFVTDYTRSFEETTRIFYDESLKLEHCAIWKE
ncbi:MAG: glutamate racemase [Bacteroidota bacterium]